MKYVSSKIIGLLAFFAMPSLATAQAVAGKTVDPLFWEKTFGNLMMASAVVVIIGAMLAIVRLFNNMAYAERKRILREQGIEPEPTPVRSVKPSFWSRFLKSATKTVPVAQEEEILLSHEYDGIRELDNRLPPWWLWLFYASIVYSAIYWFMFHMSDIGPSQKEEYQRSMEMAKAEIAAYQAGKGEQIDETTVVALTDAMEIGLGQAIFTANCTPCHGVAGEGNSIGPNLTDDHWLNGCGIHNVFKTINHGRVEKGMQAWGETLRPSDIQRVASYILTLSGSNPPNAKAPQGDLCDPAAAMVKDTMAVAQ